MNKVLHITGKYIDKNGMFYLAHIELTNLKELALNDKGIKNLTLLEKANFPQLEYLIKEKIK